MTKLTVETLLSTYEIEVERGKRINLKCGTQEVEFKRGDRARFSKDAYQAEIKSISEKQIVLYERMQEKTYKLNLEQFAWRNL